jgi:hypothetical protein
VKMPTAKMVRIMGGLPVWYVQVPTPDIR